MILKDRQLGLTELLGARLLYKMAFSPAFLGAVISINREKAIDVSSRVKGMTGSLNITWERDADTKRKVERGGEVHFLPSTENAVRALPSVVELVYDEAGFLPKFSELYGAGTSAQEMVGPADRKTILNTTVPPEGTLSEFWGMFDSDNPPEHDAVSMVAIARDAGSNCDIPGMVWWTDTNGWAKVVLSHKAHPKYGSNPNYLQEVQERRKIPWSIVLREHNLGIETAQGGLFDSSAINKQATGAWSEPIPGHLYLGCTDPNFGGSDNYVTQIWDVTDYPRSLVAEYAEADRSTEYSKDQSLTLFDRYGCQLVAVESNSGGKVVAENYIKARPKLRVEVTLTTNASKRVNTDRIAFALEQSEIIYPKKWQGIAEMRRFSAKDRQATGGEKDDRIMAWAAGWAWVGEISSPKFGKTAHLTKGQAQRVERDHRNSRPRKPFSR